MVYFKIKFKMISGTAYFAARACNYTDSQECLVRSIAQTKSDSFETQQNRLKTDIVKYYSLY